MLIIWKNRTKMFLYSPQRHHSSISVSAVALCGCRFSAVTFRASAPTTRASLWTSYWRSAQKTMKDEAKQMVLVGDQVIFFSKHTLFLALQRAQQTAANPTIWYFPPWPMNLWAKTQNWSTEQGLQLTPTTRATMLRAFLAREHSKNKWLTVSLSDKTWQVALPCHFLLNRLSLVKM